MARKRRSFGAAFKAKVALAACRGEKTTAQLAAEFGIHAGQITAWKKQLLEGAVGLFEDGRGKRAADDAANDQELYEQIGRLKMEVEWLKKKSCRAHLKDCGDGSNRNMHDSQSRGNARSWDFPTARGITGRRARVRRT